MLTIYDSNTTLFNHLGLGVLKDFKSDPLIIETLNKEYNLEFEYVVNGALSEYLIKENIIKANGQLFRIWNVKETMNTIVVLAKHKFFDLEKNFLEDVAPTDLVGQNALAWMLARTQHPNNINVLGDCTKVASARYVRLNPIEAIYNADNALLKRFGGELELDNDIVKLHNKRGKDTGIDIRYGKNVVGVDFNIDLSSVITRVMPQGNDGILLPEKYIDSPLIGNYFAPLYFKYEVNVGVDEEAGITLEDCYDIMREETKLLFEGGADKPTVSLAIDFIELAKTEEYKKYSNLESAHLGDSCKCYIPKLGIDTTIRVVKTIYNCAKKRIVKVELGTPTPDISSANVNTENAVKNALERVNPESILQKAKEDATKLINHPFGGFMYISEETGEWFLMDTNDINTAQDIWKFGLGGIGFSSTGINGVYEIAITQDGRIVADFISTGRLDAGLIEGYNELELKVIDLEEEVQENYSSIKATIENMLTTVQRSGGSNLLINSVMFAYNQSGLPTNWQVSGSGTLEIESSAEAISSGSKAGNVFILNNKTVRQRIIVKPNDNTIPEHEKVYYTFSCKIKKGSIGSCYVKIFNENEEYIVELPSGVSSFYGEYEIRALLPTTNYYDIEFYGSQNSNATFTDNMFNLGDIKTPWQQASGEIMNTQVNINVDGVLVKSSVFLGDYTVMSPLEFAGYSMINGVLTKIFTLNKDRTIVKKLSAEDEIGMKPIKIVPKPTGDVTGWAFVTTQ